MYAIYKCNTLALRATYVCNGVFIDGELITFRSYINCNFPTVFVWREMVKSFQTISSIF